MSSSAFEGGTFDKLEGSTDTTGGLIIKKPASKHKFESPKTSMLGLQQLAAEKRKEKELLLKEDTKKSKLSSRTEDWENYNDKDRSDDRERGKANFSAGNREQREKSRHYRTYVEDTPTHTGGVSNEAREKQLRRMERDRERRGHGVFAETRERKDKYSKDGDRRDDRRDERGR